MSESTTSVQDYIAIQPQLGWRRRLMRGLIRAIGFGVLARADITGLENIPDTGPAILMMNHISGVDPIVCMGAVTHRYVIPMAKVELMSNPALAFFIRWWGAFIVRRGEIDRKALVNSIELARSGQLVLIAPEGHRHPEGLSQPHDGLAYVATKSNAVIIPTALSEAQDWKDRLKHFRRIYVRLHFGPPFRFKVAGSRATREELSLMSEEAMYQLALAVQDPSARGIYSDLSKATTHTLEFVDPRDPDRPLERPLVEESSSM